MYTMFVERTSLSVLVLTRPTWVSSLPMIISKNKEHSDKTEHNAYNVDVTEFIEPEIVRCAGSHHKVSLGQLLVDLCRRDVELVEDPLLHEALLSCGLNWVLPNQFRFQHLQH